LILANKSIFRQGKEQFVSEDLIKHLQEHGMIMKDQPIDIYARDINEPTTADFFLKTRVYGCEYKASRNFSLVHYFAPYFGRDVAWTHPGLLEGISYVAKIESVQIAKTAEDFNSVTREARGNGWFKRNRRQVSEIADRFFPSKKEYSFLYLSTPRLAFNPPIQKRYLSKGRGFLSKQYYSFDQFYQAWSGELISS
jgi:hypothetical protein